jgi:hypothetical protein
MPCNLPFPPRPRLTRGAPARAWHALIACPLRAFCSPSRFWARGRSAPPPSRKTWHLSEPAHDGAYAGATLMPWRASLVRCLVCCVQRVSPRRRGGGVGELPGGRNVCAAGVGRAGVGWGPRVRVWLVPGRSKWSSRGWGRRRGSDQRCWPLPGAGCRRSTWRRGAEWRAARTTLLQG